MKRNQLQVDVPVEVNRYLQELAARKLRVNDRRITHELVLTALINTYPELRTILFPETNG